MPLLVTPRQLSQRAEFYHQLGQLTAAGISLPQALGNLQKAPPARSFREPLGRLLEHLHQGATFSGALQQTGAWLPAFDQALLQAGESSGRLPDCFKMLADFYQERSRLVRQVLSDLAYPVFLFHFAILLGPLPALFQSWNVLAYLTQICTVLLPIYAVVIALLFAAQGRHGERWRAFIERVLGWIPLCGVARRSLALARLAAALEALITAGVTIIEAWELAAAASGSPALRRAVLAWKPEVLAGLTPAEAVNRSREFPELFANLYHTGEISGQLDQTLIRLRHLYQEEGSRKLRAVAEWAPKVLYFGIALMIAWRVISFWTNYFSKISDAINF